MGNGPVIAAEKLSKRFSNVVALDGVSFTIEGPGLVGILGPNGAGKTTLLEVLEGLSAPTSGSFRLFGQEPDPYPRARVGVVMQKEVQLERCTTEEYAELFAAIYGIRGGRERIVQRAKLEARAKTAMSRLSGGEAARLFISAALVHEPALVFLDETTAPLDPKTKREIGEMLRESAKERTIVLATHDLREADLLCDRVMFLLGGKLRAHGTREELARAVPEEARTGHDFEDAFFHFCGGRMKHGEIQSDDEPR